MLQVVVSNNLTVTLRNTLCHNWWQLWDISV